LFEEPLNLVVGALQPAVQYLAGQLPTANTIEDRWPTTAPVRTYEPNGYGLWQTIGNISEWVDDIFDHVVTLRAYERDSAGIPQEIR
jgi:formylglycine-generating enzyme